MSCYLDVVCGLTESVMMKERKKARGIANGRYDFLATGESACWLWKKYGLCLSGRWLVVVLLFRPPGVVFVQKEGVSLCSVRIARECAGFQEAGMQNLGITC